MEPDQKHAAVGVFVLAGCVALAGTALWLQGYLANRGKACYVMRFDNSVAGLSQGSAITLRGVRVGQVEAIRINPANDEQILVRAALDRTAPIKPTTVASLKPQGITGSSYIELDFRDGETRSGEKLREGDCRLIATLPSGIDQIFDRLPQLLDNAVQVTERMAQALDATNMANVSATLANLNQLTGELNKTSAHLGPKLEEAASQLNAAMASLNNLTRQLDGNGATAASLQETIRQARGVLVDVKALTEDLRANPRRVLLAPTANEVKVP